MRLTKLEAERLGINPKAWTAAMQRACREPGAPSFKMRGPVSLQVRTRRLSGTTAVARGTHYFVGDEALRVTGLTVDTDPMADAVLISVLLQPATTDLAAEIAGLTLTLSECMELLEGFEDFATSHQMAVAPARAEKPMTIAQRTEALREENPLYGAW